MAQYWEDWSGSEIDAEPTGWTKRFSSVDITYTVEEEAAPEAPAGRRLRIDTATAGSTNIRRLLTLDAVDSDADRQTFSVAILTKSQTLAIDAIGVGGAGRGAGSSGSETAVVGSLARSSGNRCLRSIRYNSGTSTQNNATTASLTNGDWYWFVVVVSGASVVTTVRSAADPETVLVTDSRTVAAVDAAGWVGVFAFMRNTIYDIAAIGIGTGGDAAPMTSPNMPLVVANGVIGVSSSTVALPGSPLIIASSSLAMQAGGVTLPADVIQVVTDVDAGNISSAAVIVTNGETDFPTIWLNHRPGAAETGWRHFLFAIENAEGKRPLFQMYRGSRITTNTPDVAWRPLWTQDFVTYVEAPSRTLVGGSSGHIEWQFTDPLPDGTIYVMSQPMGRQIDAVNFAAELLTTYSAVAEPASSADSSGVFFTSPAETDDIGRAVGGNPLYAFKLAWGGVTNDGGPKRKLVVFAGLHAAGENTSWVPFRRFCDWILNDTSAAAVAFRANWDVWLYFNITPNGLKGGNYRKNFRSSQDPNRDFKLSGSSTLVEITAVRAASVADVGTCDCFLSWHGHSTRIEPFIPGKNDQNAPTASAKTEQFIAIGEAVFGVPAVDYSSDTLGNTDAWWGEAQLGASISLHAEIQQNGPSSHAGYLAMGENWAKTVAEADAQGVFYDPSLVGAAAAAAAASAALTTAIPLTGAALATASASGAMSSSVSLAGAAASVSIADGTLTTEVVLSGAALAQAAAAAVMTTTPAGLEGAAQAGASASGGLTTGVALAGDAAAMASALGLLTIEIRLAGAAVAQAVADADLATDAAGLAGDALAQAGATALLGTAIPLVGEATASAAASGALGVPILLSGAAAAVSSATGELTLAIALEGHSLAAALAAGTLTTSVQLSGAALAQAAAAGALAGESRDVPTFRVHAPAARSRVFAPIRRASA